MINFPDNHHHLITIAKEKKTKKSLKIHDHQRHLRAFS